MNILRAWKTLWEKHNSHMYIDELSEYIDELHKHIDEMYEYSQLFLSRNSEFNKRLKKELQRGRHLVPITLEIHEKISHDLDNLNNNLSLNPMSKQVYGDETCWLKDNMGTDELDYLINKGYFVNNTIGV